MGFFSCFHGILLAWECAAELKGFPLGQYHFHFDIQHFNHIVSEVWWRGWCYVMVMRAENASLAGYLAVLSILDIRESECSFAAAAVRWLARHGDRPKGCQQQSVERPPRPGHSDQEEQEVEVEYLLKTVTGGCLLIFYSLSFIQFKEFSCDSTNRVFPFPFPIDYFLKIKDGLVLQVQFFWWWSWCLFKLQCFNCYRK